ncbi:MAG: hypothetical protein D6785_16675, partial [Planctomycetota bacterium]
MKTLFTPQELEEKILKGEGLLLAGDEELLRNLPKGNWIGGTIPYFMSEKGGLCTQEEIQAVTLPDFLGDLRIKAYCPQEIGKIAQDYPEHGISFIVMPGGSEIHQKYAKEVYNYPQIFNRPLVGWITGIKLEDMAKVSPKVFDGQKREVFEDKALVLHASLPENIFAKIDIVNIFEQGEGDTFVFLENGFSAKECLVNGEKRNFAEYVREKNLDIRLPLVTNLFGSMINTSFQEVREDEVTFYAPVFEGLEYRQAKAVEDYEKEFEKRLSQLQIEPLFSCNCILNYLY